jgi:hypothetical protein
MYSAQRAIKIQEQFELACSRCAGGERAAGRAGSSGSGGDPLVRPASSAQAAPGFCRAVSRWTQHSRSAMYSASFLQELLGLLDHFKDVGRVSDDITTLFTLKPGL